ncbi:MAG: Hsp20/alpha crystallin family protein [Chitinophagaceae bacterium]|nr:Hsp20/alpha crystallin family protein [Chitinophagaceae bacterium]
MTNANQNRNLTSSKEMTNVVDGIFNNTLRRFFDGNLWDAETINSRGSVPVNVRETDQHYEVDVVAPGCRKEDFSVMVQHNELQVSCVKDEAKKDRDENAGWVRNEYVQRSFRRHFTLDDTVDAQKINATYTDGILRITLPKTEKAKPRLLSIEVK